MRYRSWLAALFALAFSFSLGVAALADVPSGAVINATLQQTLDTKTSRVGDPVLMTIASISPETAFDPSLKGATIRGHVSQVVGATPTKKAYIGIAFDTLTLADGRTYPFPAKIMAFQKQQRTNAGQAAGEIL